MDEFPRAAVTICRQPGVLKPTAGYALPALEAGSLKQAASGTTCPLKALGENPSRLFQFLVVALDLWCEDTTVQSLSLASHGVPPACLCPFL